jgi:8-oxo-dGTP diphosphatase
MSEDRSILYPTSHIIIENENSEVLLLHRFNTGCYDGYWCLPGGKVDPKEQPGTTAKREAKEELDVNISVEFRTTVIAKLDKVFDPEKSIFEDLSFYFYGTIISGTPINKEINKHDDMRWFSTNSLPDRLIPTDKIGLDCHLTNIAYNEYGY